MYSYPYQSQGIFRKVLAFLQHGVAPILVDRKLLGLKLEARGKELGAVG